MLVLSRTSQEVIVINDVIRIQVIKIGPNRVKLAIDAPRDVSVHREEVWEAIQKELRRKKDFEGHGESC